MGYRLGIDLGTNSLGWCVLPLGDDGAPDGNIHLGVGIYSDGRDPQSKQSLAVDRRIARQARRRRDRMLYRRDRLLSALIRHGLMPKDEAARRELAEADPYRLRAAGLDGRLELHDLGRALFHLNQRRGYRHSRSGGGDDEKDVGVVRSGIDSLASAMSAAGARTVGEYLNTRHQSGEWVRARPIGKGTMTDPRRYDLYVSREMISAEFDSLWTAQSAHYPIVLTEAVHAELRDIIFHQRELKPVRAGRCRYVPTEERAPWALPIAQEFRMLQELANLRIVTPGTADRALNRADRDIALAALRTSKTLTFAKLIKALKLPRDTVFNLASNKRDGLLGDQTGTRLSNKDAFGAAWWTWPIERRTIIVERLLADTDEDSLVVWLMGETSLAEAACRKAARTTLPEGHCALGRAALSLIVPLLASEDRNSRVIRLHEAVPLADPSWHHSDDRTGEQFDRLPYYGEVLEAHVAFGSGNPEDTPEKRYGRIANPTVHIGLNQLRRVVNSLIARFGPPEAIVIELARELKQPKKVRDRLQKEQAENQAMNEERRKRLALLGLQPSGGNMMRMRLFDELPAIKLCVYTSATISQAAALGPLFEVDHILPFATTLDDSFANKVLVSRDANRFKRKRTPHEAFSKPDSPWSWEGVLARAQELPENKRRRFQPDALDRLARDGGDFLARQLTDTQYLSRIAKRYLGFVCNPDAVSASPGRLTGLLRGKWGLNDLISDHNRKNRDDHRHHAIDAFVLATTTRGLLNEISKLAGRDDPDGVGRFLAEIPDPFPAFDREKLRGALDAIVVAHRPEHGATGPLHEATPYGLVKTAHEREAGYTLVTRKSIGAFKKRSEIEAVRDPTIRAAMQTAADAAAARGEKIEDALAAFGHERGIRRVRVLKAERSFIKIGGSSTYKALIPGDNHCVEVWRQPDGTWKTAAVTIFDANSPSGDPKARRGHPAAKRIMRIHKQDLVKLEVDGDEKTMRVVRLAPGNSRLYLVPDNEGGVFQKRHEDPDDPFEWHLQSFSSMQSRKFRVVRVTASGQIVDPGPFP